MALLSGERGASRRNFIANHLPRNCKNEYSNCVRERERERERERGRRREREREEREGERGGGGGGGGRERERERESSPSRVSLAEQLCTLAELASTLFPFGGQSAPTPLLDPYTSSPSSPLSQHNACWPERKS